MAQPQLVIYDEQDARPDMLALAAQHLTRAYVDAYDMMQELPLPARNMRLAAALAQAEREARNPDRKRNRITLA